MMPVLREEHTPTITSTTSHTNLLAILGMGLDLVGKVPKYVGGHEYLFVAIDKFTKWVEVMPIPRQMAEASIKFIE